MEFMLGKTKKLLTPRFPAGVSSDIRDDGLKLHGMGPAVRITSFGAKGGDEPDKGTVEGAAAAQDAVRPQAQVSEAPQPFSQADGTAASATAPTLEAGNRRASRFTKSFKRDGGVDGVARGELVPCPWDPAPAGLQASQ